MTALNVNWWPSHHIKQIEGIMQLEDSIMQLEDSIMQIEDSIMQIEDSIMQIEDISIVQIDVF